MSNMIDEHPCNRSEPDEPNARTRLLQNADEIVNGDRNAQYGDPNQDFKRTAELWTVYLRALSERNESNPTPGLEPHDVAMMMMLLKISRGTVSPNKFDTWLDIAGYAACGWSCIEDD